MPHGLRHLTHHQGNDIGFGGKTKVRATLGKLELAMQLGIKGDGLAIKQGQLIHKDQGFVLRGRGRVGRQAGLAQLLVDDAADLRLGQTACDFACQLS